MRALSELAFPGCAMISAARLLASPHRTHVDYFVVKVPQYFSSYSHT